MDLLPAIVVLNDKYKPRSFDEAPQVGASSFFSSVIDFLSACNKLSGLVYYRRDESITNACCSVTLDQSIPSVTVCFNFQMPVQAITSALSTAFTQVIQRSGETVSPIVYYQTDIFLHYHPTGLPFCVTHHGPFVADFVRCFSEKEADLAFGGKEKRLLLAKQQYLGVKRLREAASGMVLVHSRLQQHVLESVGINKRQFLQLTPPIEPTVAPERPLPLHIEQMAHEAEILLFTAVARLDYFKNVQMIVQAGLKLVEKKFPIHVLIAGDPNEKTDAREQLRQMIPPQYRPRFLLVPKLPKHDLYALMARVKHNSIFICPSRYETLGITPLEAAATGVATLITDSTNVEAASYFPPTSRIELSADAIGDKVLEIHREGIAAYGSTLKMSIEHQTSPIKFRQDLLRAWAKMSTVFARQLSDGTPRGRLAVRPCSYPVASTTVSEMLRNIARVFDFRCYGAGA